LRITKPKTSLRDKRGREKFKPCERLTSQDLAEYPIWGFDLSLEGFKGGDETWVRPYRYRAVPETSDVLFAAARIKPGAHKAHKGAVTFRFINSKPELDGCVLFKPRFCGISASFGHGQRGYLLWALGEDLSSFFPLAYAANVVIGGQRFSFAGTIALSR